MKEFGVGICKENQDVSKWNLADLLCIDFGRIYVAPESEHIFDLKDGDLGIGYHTDLWQFGKGRWVFRTDEEYQTEKDCFIKNIIKRDNKQFFYPEVEND